MDTVWVLVLTLITTNVPGENNGGDPPMQQMTRSGFVSEEKCVKAGADWLDRKVNDDRVSHASFNCKEIAK